MSLRLKSLRQITVTAGVVALSSFTPRLEAGGRVLRTLQDFESGPAVSLRAGLPIKAKISTEGENGGLCLEARIPENFAWRWKGANTDRDQPLLSVSLSALASPFLPPEADAVRARIWVRSGRALVAVGGPVSQMGCSDVFCDPQLLEAGEGWQTVEFSLNHSLLRNFRRANFTKDLPVVSYTRWAQEPVQLYVLALPESMRPAVESTILFDQFQLIARNEGKPFPDLKGSNYERHLIADFTASDADLSQVCCVAHGYSTLESFEEGYRRRPLTELRPVPEQFQKASPFIREEGISYPAPRITLKDLGSDGRALQAEGVWMEEGQVVALKAKAPSLANALSFNLKVNFPNLPRNYRFQMDEKEARAVDFVVFVSPHGAADFPWKDLAPREELASAFQRSNYTGPGSKFDYLLVSQRNNLAKAEDIRSGGAFGFYTTRRLVPAAEWSETVIPFSDFLCVYGQGACEGMQRTQAELDPKTIAAVGIVMPFGTGHGVVLVSKASFVSLPAAEAGLRSYYQPLRAPALTTHRLHDFGWLMMSPNKTLPGFLGPSSPTPR